MSELRQKHGRTKHRRCFQCAYFQGYERDAERFDCAVSDTSEYLTMGWYPEFEACGAFRLPVLIDEEV